MRFNGLRERIGRGIYRHVGRANGLVQRTRPLSADVLENDVSYLVIFDTPGVGSEDLEVRYVTGRVRIRVDRFREFYDGFEMRFPGRSMELDGEIELPEDAVVDPEAATARVSDVGTVKIEIPKEDAEGIQPTGTEEIEIDD